MANARSILLTLIFLDGRHVVQPEAHKRGSKSVAGRSIGRANSRHLACRRPIGQMSTIFVDLQLGRDTRAPAITRVHQDDVEFRARRLRRRLAGGRRRLSQSADCRRDRRRIVTSLSNAFVDFRPFSSLCARVRRVDADIGRLSASDDFVQLNGRRA